MFNGLDAELFIIFEFIGFLLLALVGTWEIWRLICKGLQLSTASTTDTEDRSELLERYLDMKTKILGTPSVTPELVKAYENILRTHTAHLRERLVKYKKRFLGKRLPTFARQKLSLREEAILYEEVVTIQ